MELIDDRKIKFKQALGPHLRLIRKQKNIPKNMAAHDAGIDVVYYDLIERGKKSITLDLFIKIAMVLDIPVVKYADYLEDA